MFDYLDPVGTIANKYAGIPKTGVNTPDDPQNFQQMVASRIPGSATGSGDVWKDIQNMHTGSGDTAEDKRKKVEDAQQAAARGIQMKKGGRISKADMQKAGFYDKDKTKSERQAIVSKVTTKPQRVAIVEKAFSTKNMKAGGSVSSASKRADGIAQRGKTKGKYI